MDMYYEEYLDYINHLMVEVLMHNVEMACEEWAREAAQNDADDDGILIDEA